MAQPIPIKLKSTIHDDYVTSDTSVRGLAARYGVSKSTIAKWMKEEAWTVEKKAYLKLAAEKANEDFNTAAEQYVDKLSLRAAAIFDSADKLLEKVNQLLALDDALAPRDLKSISSTLLDIKMIHDIKPEETKKDADFTVKFSGGEDLDA